MVCLPVPPPGRFLSRPLLYQRPGAATAGSLLAPASLGRSRRRSGAAEPEQARAPGLLAGPPAAHGAAGAAARLAPARQEPSARRSRARRSSSASRRGACSSPERAEVGALASLGAVAHRRLGRRLGCGLRAIRDRALAGPRTTGPSEVRKNTTGADRRHLARGRSPRRGHRRRWSPRRRRGPRPCPRPSPAAGG